MKERLELKENEIVKLKAKLEEGEYYSRSKCLKLPEVKLDQDLLSDVKISSIANTKLGFVTEQY